jgi:putative transport protein
VHVLENNPVMLLFVIAAAGVAVAKVRVRGFSVGIAAVLFVGILLGSLDSRLQIPEEIWVLGLAVFVYTIGLASGPGFVRALRRRGVSANLLVLGALTAAAGVAYGVHAVLPAASRAEVAGSFTGGVTNTPALATVLQSLEGTPAEVINVPVVGYSLSYPLGVVVPLLVVAPLLRRSRRQQAPLVSRSIVIEHPVAPLGELRRAYGSQVAFGRVQQGTSVTVATDELVLAPGDIVSVVGPLEEVMDVAGELGRVAAHPIEFDHRAVDVRRVVVSSRRVAGVAIDSLGLDERFGATITRIRRGDVDLVAEPEMQLELGDRVRVVCARERMPEVSRFLGDSYRALGEIDVLSFGFGIAAGLALGAIALPLPGGGSFELGSAGGPLVVGLALGAIGRTGPMVWQLPYTASLTLRQFGTVIFLAGIGLRAGGTFGGAVTDPSSLYAFLAGALVTLVALALLMAGGSRVLHLSPETLAGVIAGAQTQPAVLAFASEQLEDDREVNIGYATVYPVALISKIILAQLILGVA